MKFPEGDPRNAKTLDEACKNPDGTYNAWRLGSWLTSIVGKNGFSPEELKAEYEKRKARGKR